MNVVLLFLMGICIICAGCATTPTSKNTLWIDNKIVKRNATPEDFVKPHEGKNIELRRDADNKVILGRLN